MIIRREKQNNYSTTSNICTCDETLSAVARCIYLYVMTLPDDWRVYKTELFTHFREGKHTLNKAMKELKDKGYYEVIKSRNAKGHFRGSEIVFHEFSILNEADQVIIDTKADKAGADYVDKLSSFHINQPLSNQAEIQANDGIDDDFAYFAELANDQEDQSQSIAFDYMMQNYSLDSHATSQQIQTSYTTHSIQANEFNQAIENTITDIYQTNNAKFVETSTDAVAHEVSHNNESQTPIEPARLELANLAQLYQKPKNKAQTLANQKISHNHILKANNNNILTIDNTANDSSTLLNKPNYHSNLAAITDLKEDLQYLGLNNAQINSVFKSYELNRIEEAVTTTFQAAYERKVQYSSSQYFYGILKNLQSQQGVYANA
ncbi:hypothetical protein [Francisella sp. TX07-6608]|uniref:hypothetical protein n=1 Tax=Francisella sp. TX07-6608 TaxID=573568 RepID=UPI0008F9851D|nr:hypothetical protein [Francisella sp. TX07-6608]OIN82973.1 hypothetical protein KX00_2036 [Francisella sp. TX07-6608]